MTDSRKVQLEAGLDASGVRKGAGDVKDIVRDMSQVVGQEAGKAAKSVDGIGAGAGASAGQVDKAARSIISSIERTTAAAKAGEKGTADYFAALAQQRGVGADVIKPYLDQLRQAEVAQRAAAGGLDKMGVSAKQTAAALRGVPAQFTDIITSLQGGQAPLTVLLQQGGQLKDMFGGVGAAARALGGFVLGLVNPYTLAAAAVGGLAVAYNMGANEAQAFQRTTILSGQAAGVTADQLSVMAAAIKSLGVGTQGRAAEVLNSIAGSADIGAGNMQRFVAAALQLEKVGGPAAEETAKAFAGLAKEPLTAALKLNEGTNFLTRSVYEQIKALSEQGRTVDAARVAQEAYSSAIEQRTPQLLQNLGYVERAWLAIKSATKGAADAALNIGRGNTLEDQIKAVQARIESAQTGIYSRDKVPALRQELALLQEQARLLQRGAESSAQRAASLKASVEFDKEADKYLTKQAQQARDIAKVEALGLAAGRSRVEIEKQIAAIREKYADKATAAGPKSVAANSFDVDALRAYSKGLADLGSIASGANANADALSKTQAKLLQIQADPAWAAYSRQQQEQIIVAASLAQAEEDRAEATKSAARTAQDAAKAQAQFIDELTRSGDAAAKQVQALRDEEAALLLVVDGTVLLRQAVELVSIARLQERQIALAGNTAAVSALQREIDQRRELATLLGSQDARKAAADAATAAEKEWKRTADSINESLTDALLRGFESGKDFAQTLRDTVVNMFKTLVLRPVVSAVVNPLAQAVTGSLGLSGAANAAGGASGSLSTLGSLAGIGGSLGAFGSFAGTGASMLFGGAGLGAVQGGLAALTGGSTAAGLGLLAGALGPIALGLAAVTALLKDKSASLGYGAASVGANGAIGAAGRQFAFGRGNDVGAQTQLVDVSRAVLASIAGSATAFGGTAGAGLTVQTATDIDRKGLGSGTIQLVLDGQRLGGVQTGGSNPMAQAASKIEAGKLGEFFAGATSAAIVAGLQASDLPAKFADYFDSFDAFSLSKEQADAVLATASAVNTLTDKFSGLGGPFDQLSGLSVKLADGLLQMFGGIEGFSQSVSSYYANFYSEAERSARATDQLQASLGKLGLAMPATREGYRALVDAQDLTTEAGRNTYAALLQLSPAFADVVAATTDLGSAAGQVATDVTKAAEEMAAAGRKVLADLAGEQAGLQVDLLRAQGQTSQADTLQRQQALAALTTGLSAADAAAAVAAYEYNDALRAQIVALGQATEAQAEQQRQQQAAAAERFGIESQLLQLQGDTAALRARELASLDAGNRALQEQVYALADKTAADQAAAAASQQAAAAAQAEAAAQQAAAQAVATQRAGLERELLQAQGDSAALQALERAALDDSNRALYDQIAALGAAKVAAESAAQAERDRAASAAAIAQERLGLEQRLLTLQGDTTELRRRELAALDPANRALGEQINALQDLAEAQAQSAQAAAEAQAQQVQAAATAQAALAAIADERAGLDRQLLQAQGDTLALRALDRAALDKSNRALFDQIRAIEDRAAAAQVAAQAEQAAAQIAEQAAQAALQAEQERAAILAGIASERAGLDRDLLTLQGNAAALRDLDRAALDESNRALFDQIEALRDQQSAAEQAAQSLQRLQSALDGLASTRIDLQAQLLTAQGDTAGAARLTRDRDLAQLTAGLSAAEAERVTAAYDYNAALRDQITTLQAGQQAAADAAQAEQQAAAQAAQSAQALRESWQSAADTIFDEVARIRGLIAGESPLSLAGAQAQFGIASAQARAGDQTAAGKLPALAQALLGLAESQSASYLDLQRLRGQTAAALERTGQQIGAANGLVVPISTPPGGAQSAEATRTASLVAEVQGLRDDNRAQAAAIAGLQARWLRLVERWELDGMPETRTAA